MARRSDGCRGWRSSVDDSVSAVYPPCVPFAGATSPTDFLRKIDDPRYDNVARVHCVERESIDGSRSVILVTVWLNFSLLTHLHSGKERDYLFLLCSWMSDEWHLLENTSFESLMKLCVSHIKPDMPCVSPPIAHSELSFLSVLNSVPRPVLLRPWDQLRISDNTCRSSVSNSQSSNTNINPIGNGSSNNDACIDMRIFNAPSLPCDMMREICHFLDAHSLFNLSLCNSYLRDCTLGCVPGLHLKLHPHQFTTVWWMLQQEQHYSKNLRNYHGLPKEMSTNLKHLHERPFSPCAMDQLQYLEDLFQQPGTLTCFFYKSDGEVHDFKYNFQSKSVALLKATQNFTHSHVGCGTTQAVRGGMLCDEPGLGKTVSMLAVILKTLGSISTLQERQDEIFERRSSSLRRNTAAFTGRSVRTISLLPSGTTLVIIPNVLMDHWKMQINTHIDPRVLRKVYFDDNIHGKLPSYTFLASCHVVVTTFRRLSNEWKHGKPLCSLDRRRRDDADNSPRVLSDLLRVKWLRVVVDEGHSLGQSTQTNVIQMACTLECDRRWVLTGTPTPTRGDGVNSELLRHIYNILTFLRHDPFGREQGEQLWKRLVSRPLETGHVSTSMQPKSLLVQVLTQVMIRHSKENIPEIPKPTWTESRLELNAQEKASYNAVVALAKSNLVLTGKDPTYPGPKHPDSLLNPTNQKFLKQTLSNIRVASCGGGHTLLKLVPFEAQKMACLQLLRSINCDIVNSKEGETLRDFEKCESKVSSFISDVTRGVLHECEKCAIRLPLLLITPCYHLFCADCMNDMGNYCRLCEKDFSWEMFQKVQPGFEASEYVFHEDHIGVYGVSEPRPHSASHSRPIQEPEQSHVESASALLSTDETTSVSTKAHYVITRIMELESQYSSNMKLFSVSQFSSLLHKKTILPKIVVFSQFSEFLDKLTVDFKEMGIKFAYFRGADKAAAIKKFRTISDVRVLVLTKEGSLGLDLSFVTHIFLMDSIMDESVLSQVVSRAYRMGARQGVAVDQVMMKDTIEETIFTSRKMNKKTLQSLLHRNMKEYCRIGSRPSDIVCDGVQASSTVTRASTVEATATTTSALPDILASGTSDTIAAAGKQQGNVKVVSAGKGTTSFSILHFFLTSLSLLKS